MPTLTTYCLLISIASLIPFAHADAAEASRQEEFSCMSKEWAPRLPRTYQELLKLSTPLRVRDGEIIKYDEYAVTYRDIEFPGLTIQVVVFSNDPKRYGLSALKVFDRKWLVAPLRVGEPLPPVARRKTLPPIPTDGAWDLSGPNESLTVRIARGRVVEFNYSCYTG